MTDIGGTTWYNPLLDLSTSPSADPALRRSPCRCRRDGASSRISGEFNGGMAPLC